MAELFWGPLCGLAVILFFSGQKFRQEPWGDGGLSRAASVALGGGKPGLWVPEDRQSPGVPMAALGGAGCAIVYVALVLLGWEVSSAVCILGDGLPDDFW